MKMEPQWKRNSMDGDNASIISYFGEDDAIDPQDGAEVGLVSEYDPDNPSGIDWTESFEGGNAESIVDPEDSTPAITEERTRTVTVTEDISDFSDESIAEYESEGWTAYALYDDGTRAQIPWSEVVEPDEYSVELYDVASATNQHFWHDGNGAHVTDDEQDAWTEEYAKSGHGELAAPADSKPWHNILMNSLGILLRRGLLNLVSMSKSAVAFFDGEGNGAANIVASFGKSGAQIGKSDSQHAVVDSSGLNVYNADGTLAKVNTVDVVAVKQATDQAVKDAATAKTASESAQASAKSAADSASAAAKSASDAQSDAASAKASAGGAASSAASASISAGNAATSATNAEKSASNAQASAEGAANDASAAKASAKAAKDDADAAKASAASAETSAGNAATSAGNAATSASNAETSAGNAAASAKSAEDDASAAKASAGSAATSASNAATSASSAATSASNAATSASNAAKSASDAASDASSAKASAERADKHADAALDQLSIVQDVVGVLTWASEHGTFKKTADKSIVSGKVYFAKDGDSYAPVVEPDASKLSTYYELAVDEAMDSYIMAHLAVTDAGLWVLPNGRGGKADSALGTAPGYKVLLSNSGTVVYDPTGVAVSTFGESIGFNADRPQRIGGDKAYIEWYDSNNDGKADSLRIVGTNLNTQVEQQSTTITNLTESVKYGGRNLLQGTADPQVDTVGNPPCWWIGSGGNGTGTIETVTDSPVPSVVKSFRITNNTTGNRDWQQKVADLYADWDGSAWSGGQFTFSAYVRAIGAECTALLRTWGSAQNWNKTFKVGADWTRVEYPVTLSGAAPNTGYVRMLIGLTGAGSIEYIAPKLERGPFATPWEYAAEDVTSMSNTVNSVKQTANENSASIKSLTTTVNSQGTRIASAESKITQHDSAIALRATKTEAYQSAQPNLSPFFSRLPYNATAGDGGTYWQAWGTGTHTSMGNGWMRKQYSNTGTSVLYSQNRPKSLPELSPETVYTLLAEFRNVSNTGNVYLRCPDSGQSGAVGNIISGEGTRTGIDLKVAEGAYHMVFKTPASTASNYSTFFGICTRCDAGATADFEMRVSIYEGEYSGPYKPYSGSQLYASQAELKVESDRISARVEKNGVIAAINASVEKDGTSAAKISADKVNIEGAAIFTSGKLSKVVTTTQTEWYSSTSATSKAGGSWGTTQPSVVAGRFIWERQKVTYSDGTSEYKPSAEGVCTQGQSLAERRCLVGQSGSTHTNPWYKFASISMTGAYQDRYIVFDVTCTYSSHGTGQLRASVRQGTGGATLDVKKLEWVSRNSYIQPAKFVMAYKANAAGNGFDIDLWAKIDSAYLFYRFDVVQEGDRTTLNSAPLWTLYDKSSAGSEAGIPDGYTQVVSTDADAAQITANAAAPKTSAIAREQRIWYRQTAIGAAPGKNQTWLSTSGTGYGNWSLTVPPLTSGSTKYPKLYTAVQSQTVAQQAAGSACTCTQPLLDDSTTVIDGGNIITGSVTANQIAANAITADHLDADSVNISGKLTLGALEEGALESYATFGDLGEATSALATSEDLEALEGALVDADGNYQWENVEGRLSQTISGVSEGVKALGESMTDADGRYLWDVRADGLRSDVDESNLERDTRISGIESDLGSTRADVDRLTGFIVVDPDVPSMTMGKVGGNARSVLTDSGLEFQYKSMPVATVKADASGNGVLEVTEATVTDRLRFGDWVMYKRNSNGNLAFKWIGA